MSLDNMLKNLKDISELQAFAEAQSSTIIDLSKKLTALEQERDHLKQLLEKTVPLFPVATPSVPANRFLSTDEEDICRHQLFRLKELSKDRELTLEETRRVEIFAKILNQLKNTPKTIEVKSKNMSDEQLLAVIEEP